MLPTLHTDPATLLTYEVDAGWDRGTPDGVFSPESTADVSAIMRWASETGTPLIARGAGTGLAGGAVAERGGVILSFAAMNQIVALDVAGRSVSAQPGTVNQQLDAVVKQHGFYFPPDPSSGRSSVIGGNLGTNAGGPHCFKYGVTTNYVTGMEVVLASGEVVQLGGKALDYPEFDLLALMVGSEGTLGVITRADLRLIRNPPAVRTMMAAFASDEQAGAAVSAVIAAGLVPATMEMMDQRVMQMIEEYVQVGLPTQAGAALIIEVDGYVESLDTQIEEVADILSVHGGFDLRIATSEAERQKIWYSRKSVAGAFARLAPAFYLTDVTVPRSRLAETLADVHRICAAYNVISAHVFHAGDGNLHPLIPCHPSDADEMARVHAASKEIIEICVSREGSITGEHGVGIEKRDYMPLMYSGAELSAMVDVKEVFDPQNLMNPGKVLPAELPAVQRVEARRPKDFNAEARRRKEIFAPHNATEAAAALRALSEAGGSVKIVSSLSESLPNVHAPRITHHLLATTNLDGITSFSPEDLYVTVGAGMKLEDVQNAVRAHNMQIPMRSPWPEATVGDLLSTNLNAPLRMRYGALRDNLLATTVALADGRVIRAGRPVVKNVAGYDLPKLFVGAHGTLGLLCDATLKLVPLPRDRRTLAVSVADLAQGAALAEQLLAHALVASALVVAPVGRARQSVKGAQGSIDLSFALLYTAEGLTEDVAAELALVKETAVSTGAQVSETEISGTRAWCDFLAAADDDALLARIGLPVSSVGNFLNTPGLCEADLLLDAASGLLYARCGSAHAMAWLAAARDAAERAGGYAVATHVPASLRDAVDRWGTPRDGDDLMRALKQRFDAADVLNPHLNRA